MKSQKTAQSVAEAIASSACEEVEWGRVDYVVRRFQVGRTVAFRNIRKGVWKSVLLRDRGKKCGIRLVHIPSVERHLQGLLKAQN